LPPFARQSFEPLTAVPYNLPEQDKSIACNIEEQQQIHNHMQNDRLNRELYEENADAGWMNEYF